MSTAVISYTSLIEASSEASSVAKKLTKYADNLESDIYRKLSNYSGSCTYNISAAKGKTNSKINELRNKSTSYTKYANDLVELKKKCIATDNAVKNSVSQLTASFKKVYKINNNKVLNTINYYLTAYENSSADRRWAGNEYYKDKSVKDYIKQSIEDWWDYDGGKQMVSGVLKGILEVAIGVCTVVGAILAGGGIIALIAGAVLGVIAVVNGITNIVNEGRAYNETHNNGDPALGRRRSGENTMQDTIRRESDSSSMHKIATGIDLAVLACTAITIVSSAGKLVKNGYKWASGNTSRVKDLKVKDILFSKDNWSQFLGKTKIEFEKGITQVSIAIRKNNIQFLKLSIKDFGTDFMSNLKNSYINFDTMKDGISSTKSILGVANNLVSDGITFKNIAEDIVLPGITIVKFTTLKTNIDGQLFYDFFDNIVADDIYEIGDKVSDKIIKNSIFSSDSIINSKVLNALSTSCNINVSIPKINIPSFEMPILIAE